MRTRNTARSVARQREVSVRCRPGIHKMETAIYTSGIQLLAGLRDYVSTHADKIKTCTEIAKNSAEALSFFGALFVLYQWFVGRRDHSTQVLFDLEKQFNCGDIFAARSLVEDDAQYARLRELLIEQIAPEQPEEDVIPCPEAVQDGFDRSSALQKLDALLRFYVFIYGIRRVGQVKDLPSAPAIVSILLTTTRLPAASYSCTFIIITPRCGAGFWTIEAGDFGTLPEPSSLPNSLDGTRNEA